MNACSPIHVAVGVVKNLRGEVLIAKRPDHVHQGGLWEFPGGKVESGESLQEALRRELAEELDISVTAAQPLIAVRYDYGDVRVLLDVWQITAFEGMPRGVEGQPVAWVAPGRLGGYPFPEANIPIVKALNLSNFYVILDLDTAGSEDALIATLDELLRRGRKLLQLRAKSLPQTRFLDLARKCCRLAADAGGRLLLNTEDPALVAGAGAAGMHLASRRLLALRQRPLPASRLVGASCHNSAELQHAESLGLDYAVLAPVNATRTHPDAEPLGWQRFESLAASVNLPVFALGGLSVEDLDRARSCGARGIAGIRAFMP